MKRFVIVVGVLLFATPALSEPFEIVLHQRRAFRNTCTITLREPVTDRVLGIYECVTGGLGRGSAPLGKYEVGAFREDGWIGPRWEIHQIGVDPGEDGLSAYDPRIGTMRTWLQIHSMHGSGYTDATFGCIGVKGGPKVWAEFMANIRYLRSWTDVVRFELLDPVSAEPIAIAAKPK